MFALRHRRLFASFALLLPLQPAAWAAQPPAQCRAASGPAPATVVELYTSEGCSSCPPADRWLNTLGHGAGVVALAFHVDYWDGLGWKDPFADPLHTQRQQAMLRSAGARFAYTPQVVVNGRDWRGWPALPARQAAPAPARLLLQREGRQASVQVTPGTAGLPPQFAGYWAVVTDGEVSQVRAGENAGTELHHDHVVRRYQPLPAWPAGQAQRWLLPLSASLPAAARVVFVLTDAQTGRPLQAVELGC
jgi:hypothetical protein